MTKAEGHLVQAPTLSRVKTPVNQVTPALIQSSEYLQRGRFHRSFGQFVQSSQINLNSVFFENEMPWFLHKLISIADEMCTTI